MDANTRLIPNSIKINIARTAKQNEATTLKGLLKLNGKTLEISWTTTETGLTKQQVQRQVDETIQGLLLVLEDLGSKTSSVAITNGQLTRTYTNKKGAKSTKTYDQAKLQAKLDKAIETKTTEKKIEALRATIGFLESHASAKTEKISLVVEIPKTEKKSTEKKSLGNERKERFDALKKNSGGIFTEIRQIDASLKNQTLDPKQRETSTKRREELYDNYRKIRAELAEISFKYLSSVFGGDLLTTIKKTNVKTEISEDIKSEYQNLIQKIRQRYPNHLNLLKALNELSEITVDDVYRGYCLQETYQLIDELQAHQDLGNELDEKKIVAAANRLRDTGGIVDPTLIAVRLVQIKLQEKMSVENYAQSKKERSTPPEQMGFLKFVASNIVTPKPPDPKKLVRKFENMITKSLNNKKMSKPVFEGAGESIVIPSTLPNGVYQILLRSEHVKIKILPRLPKKNVNHSITYVKLNDHQSYLYDLNIGLVNCGDHKKTQDQLKKVQKYYVDEGYDAKELSTTIQKRVTAKT